MPIFIDVIIPFYKEIDLLPRAVKSVQSQIIDKNAVDLTITIINDGFLSNEEVMTAIADVRNLTICNTAKPESGPGAARNIGLNHSTKEWVAFLDADDQWMPSKLAEQLQLCDQYTFIATGYTLHGKIVQPPRIITNSNETLSNTTIGTSTVLIHKSVINGTRFTNRKYSQDTEFWHAVAKSPKFKYAGLSKPLTVYEPSQRTKNKLIQFMHFRKLIKDLNIPFLMRAKILFLYTKRGILNHIL